MTAARIAISLDPELARRIRKAAGKQPVSAWLADAAERRLRAEGLRRVVADWEAEHGPLSRSELAAARRKRRSRTRR